MAFNHEADGTGTDQDLLDLNREMQARIMKTGQEYRDQHGHSVRLPELSVLKKQEQELIARIGSASGPARNLAIFRRRP